MTILGIILSAHLVLAALVFWKDDIDGLLDGIGRLCVTFNFLVIGVLMWRGIGA